MFAAGAQAIASPGSLEAHFVNLWRGPGRRTAGGQAVATCRLPWKHSRQNTGRPCVGRNGTVVSLPHCEQVVRVSTLAGLGPDDGAAPNTDTRFILQALQRLGSFLNCLS